MMRLNISDLNNLILKVFPDAKVTIIMVDDFRYCFPTVTIEASVTRGSNAYSGRFEVRQDMHGIREIETADELIRRLASVLVRGC